MLDTAHGQDEAGAPTACLQEIVYENGWMTAADICESIKDLPQTEYGRYLVKLAEE